ncbi:MAG TPA: NUDIX hydrolase [Myxococcota bacterium]|nr:NUDIX hydrolase [Myxococcota bacterium]
MSGSAQPKRGFRVVVSKERFALPSGRVLELDIVKHPGAAAIVPFASERDVLLIRQYRHATRGTILEVPAGKIDPGEAPIDTAARELEEEVGQRARRIEALGSIWTTPGFTDEKIHLFAGFELEPADSRPEDDEIIESFRIALDDALQLIWRGELTDAKSALALIHAARRLGRLA